MVDSLKTKSESLPEGSLKQKALELQATGQGFESWQEFKNYQKALNMNEDFNKIPDKKKKPYTYHLWKELNMFDMTPAERVLIWELHSLDSCRAFLFGINDYCSWDKKDMAKFVKYIVPLMKKANKKKRGG